MASVLFLMLARFLIGIGRFFDSGKISDCCCSDLFDVAKIYDWPWSDCFDAGKVSGYHWSFVLNWTRLPIAVCRIFVLGKIYYWRCRCLFFDFGTVSDWCRSVFFIMTRRLIGVGRFVVMLARVLICVASIFLMLARCLVGIFVV